MPGAAARAPSALRHTAAARHSRTGVGGADAPMDTPAYSRPPASVTTLCSVWGGSTLGGNLDTASSFSLPEQTTPGERTGTSPATLFRHGRPCQGHAIARATPSDVA